MEETIVGTYTFKTFDEYTSFCDKILDDDYIPTEEELIHNYIWGDREFFVFRRLNINYLIYKEDDD